MRVLPCVLVFSVMSILIGVVDACPPTPGPAPAPAVSVAAPAAQAFAQATATPATQTFAPTVQQVLVPQAVQAFSVVQQPAVVQTVTTLPVSANSLAVANSSSRCRTGLLADLRLAQKAGRAARKAVLSSRRCGSTAVSQAIAVERT